MVDEKTVLFPSFRLANHTLKEDSAICSIGDSSHNAMFPAIGTNYTTPWAFVASEWELWGDGRSLIGDTDRILAVFSLLEKHGLEVSMGTAMQIARLVKNGYSALLDAENKNDSELSATEKAIMSLVADYSEFLDKWDYAELTEAMGAIEPYVRFSSVFVDANCILEEPYRAFFGKCEVIGASATDTIDDFSSSIDISIFRAEGTSAIEKMIFDECEKSLLDDGFKRIAIVSQYPTDQFDALAPNLCKLGIKCTKMDSQSFSKTVFGRFFLGVCRLLALAGEYGLSRFVEVEAFDWVSVASDISMNPYCAIAPFDRGCLSTRTTKSEKSNLSAKDLNGVWRADRTATVENGVMDLREVSASFARIESLFSGDANPFASIEAFERIARATFDDSQATLEIGAIQNVLSLMDSIAKFHLPSFYVPLIMQYMAANDVETFASEAFADKNGEDDAPEVVFISKAAVQNMPAAYFDEVVFSDVSDGFLNAKSRIDSTETIAKKFGLPTYDSTMQKARLSFAAALNSCKSKFVCVFPAHDVNSEESFTSFCFDELVDGLFDGKFSPKDVVSGHLEGKAVLDNGRTIEFRQMGEEKMQETVAQMFYAPKSFVKLPNVIRGKLYDLSLLDFLNHSTDPNGRTLPLISPSAIEKYLACPYQWFLDYGIKPTGLDEEFSNLERGSFAHELLRQFYDAWMKNHGSASFENDDFESVKSLYTEIAMKLLESQKGLEPNGGRYVPATLIETEEAMKLLESVLESIFYLNQLPNQFDLVASEYSISPFDESPVNVAYSDFFINGKADRVDASKDDGSFYVLDYKGSLKNHDAGLDCFKMTEDDKGNACLDPQVLPEHVQVLVYASVIAKLEKFGKLAEGAFYTSYRPKPKDPLIVGSYYSLAKELALLSNDASSVYIPFSEFLDLVERAVGIRLAAMKENDISERPANEAACKYCDYLDCERRLA